MSYHDATFWVGANAVIRKRALEDIVEIEHSGGHEIRRYVQDRTVIEDTESSLDLAIHGWWLLNYPERLSYSATPPDFGSLSIQRRRWANGGLLILPKLWRNGRERAKRGQHGSTSQTLLRVNYMASTCWSSLGLLFLLAYPFDSKLLSPLIVLAALPYFLAMASDLKRLGYKRTDAMRIYGFNLILLPVNLAGVATALQQAISGKKIPFARTPKVANRTATPLLFALSPFLIIAYSVWTVVRDVHEHNWGNAAFAGINTLAAAYAIVAFMGVRNALVDVLLGFVEHFYVTDQRRDVQVVRRSRVLAPAPAREPDWQEMLYRGAAGTQSGEYSYGDGGFRILATPPVAPKLNRRATDRRRATDVRHEPSAGHDTAAGPQRREADRTPSS
jgi:hypothetical protein